MTPPTSEQDYYMRLSDELSSAGGALNLKDTELRLGLPGSESPERVDGRGGGLKLGLPKGFFVSGTKRAFSDAIDDGAELPGMDGSEVTPEGGESSFSERRENNSGGEAKEAAAKAQAIGWPPIRRYRRNTMASSNPSWRNKEEEEEEEEESKHYIKVSMDGAPYLRKLDLKTYSTYEDLSLALEKMFITCFTLGQCGGEGTKTEGGGVMMDLLLTYEDKDGDWMLVGDVPWNMFTDSCRRLRIMRRGSDAIGGMAPMTMHKSKSWPEPVEVFNLYSRVVADQNGYLQQDGLLTS